MSLRIGLHKEKADCNYLNHILIGKWIASTMQAKLALRGQNQVYFLAVSSYLIMLFVGSVSYIICMCLRVGIHSCT